jgi:hypothetical protein
MSLLCSKRFMDIETYHSMYLQEIEIQLDGELVYPYTPSLTKNLEYADNGNIEGLNF